MNLDEFENESDIDPGHSSSSSNTSSDGDREQKQDQQTILGKKLICGLKQLRNSNVFCDVTLVVENHEIQAHKNILCALSPYFDAMLTGYFKEKNDNKIVLDNVDELSMKLIIDYLYSGNLTVTRDNVQSILDTANFLQIDTAKELCCKFLAKDIDETNCLEYILIAGKYNNATLLKKAIYVTTKNFFILYGKEELLNIEKKPLKKLLSEAYMKLYPANYIYDLILRWIKRIPDERVQYLKELLTEFVDQDHVSNEIIMKHENIADILPLDMKSWYLEHVGKIKSNEHEHVAYLFNWLGRYPCHSFNLKTRTNLYLQSVPRLNAGASFVGYQNAVYVHGGWKSKRSYTAEAFCFNICTDKWVKYIPMMMGKAYHRSCVLNDFLYIIGGEHTGYALPYVEAIDLSLGVIMNKDKLRNPRSFLGVSTYANSIYATAGINAEKNLNSIERFDPREGLWEVLPATTYGYGICSTSVVGDSMYCAMGPGQSFECFDFKMNQSTFIMPQSGTKYPNSLFTLENKLHGIFYDSMSQYNEITGSWNIYYGLGHDSNFITAILFEISAQNE